MQKKKKITIKSKKYRTKYMTQTNKFETAGTFLLSISNTDNLMAWQQ